MQNYLRDKDTIGIEQKIDWVNILQGLFKGCGNFTMW